MNKQEFIEELAKKTNYDKEKCILINNVLENNFIIGKKNKDKIIESLMNSLDFDLTEANNVYEIASSIITKRIKDKLKHPFQDMDK